MRFIINLSIILQVKEFQYGFLTKHGQGLFGGSIGNPYCVLCYNYFDHFYEAFKLVGLLLS